MSKYSPVAQITFIHPGPTPARIILLLLNFPCTHSALASPRSTLQYILWRDVVLLLCRVKQVKLAAHDRPATTSHTRYTLILITSSVRCAHRLLAAHLLCKRSSDTFPRVSTVATQNHCSTKETLFTIENTVHHRKHCLSEQHVVHKQCFITFKQAS